MDGIGQPRVTLVHDWLTGMRGGEKCLEVLCERWPNSQLYTLLHRRGSVSPLIERLAIHTSALQYLPFIHCYYRYLLPLMPRAVAGWRLPACDIVVSFSHCVAKAAQAPRGVPHVCYCFTPMRYAWHMRDAYFGASRLNRFKARLLETMLSRLRDWDRQTSERVTHFVAISRTVQRRIAECYGRNSTVIYPPVDTEFYTPAPVPRENYYLAVSAFAPYKRLDLAVMACNQLKKQLVIIGRGQDERRLRSLAGPTIHFLGWQPNAVIREHLRRCRVLLFPGEEDFGIVPVEAQACGAPVIAFGQGGVTETVVPLRSPVQTGESEKRTRGNDPTGMWFSEQSADCLVHTLEEFESHRSAFDPGAARRQALRFQRQRFATEMLTYLHAVLRSGPMPLRWAA